MWKKALLIQWWENGGSEGRSKILLLTENNKRGASNSRYITYPVTVLYFFDWFVLQESIILFLLHSGGSKFSFFFLSWYKSWVLLHSFQLTPRFKFYIFIQLLENFILLFQELFLIFNFKWLYGELILCKLSWVGTIFGIIQS